ncbi:hypothetical protein AK88_04938 [Plasmodium fragile]|uniref:Schizont-infected cell agglutination C-terminal domain-containing protein n=1 Tax=Plasmodium fragile TaxID=5857 RepID=A0A0D9QEE6_PLAFR|nr:uncharacterized protein AK88_04938 [Plasmodium fragile]KJP85435.1 hypothetical protein AK88_04938 [Plasmodium fragile]
MAAALRNLLVDYIQQRNMHGQHQPYQKAIWDDIKQLFDDFTRTIQQPDDTFAKATCEAGEKEKKIQAKEMNMCRMVVSILLYMSHGDTHAELQKRAHEHDTELKACIRTIIGTVTIQHLLKRYCNADEVVQSAVSMVNMMDEDIGPGVVNNTGCPGLKVQGLAIGGKDVTSTIGQWILQGNILDGGTGHVDWNAGCGDATSTKKPLTSIESLSALQTIVVQHAQQLQVQARDITDSIQKTPNGAPDSKDNKGAATPSTDTSASDQSNKTGQDSSPKASGKEKASNGPQGTGTTPSGTSADTSNLGRADVTPGRKDGGSQPQAPASPVLPAAPPPPAPPPEPAPEEGKNGAQGDAAPAPPAGAELGRKGDAGPAGPQGETGAEGEAGPTGPQADPASGAAAGPVQPPRPAPPPGRPSGTEDQATTSPLPAAPQPPKKDDTTPVTAPAATSPGKATCPGSNGPSPGVSISCETTSDEVLGMTPEVTKLLAQDEKERAKAPISPNPSSETGPAVNVPEPQPAPKDPEPDKAQRPCSPDDFDLSSSFGGGTPTHCTKGASSTSSSDSTSSCSGTKSKEAVAGGGSTAGGPNAITGGTQDGHTSRSAQPAPFPFDPVNIFTQDIENVAGGFVPPVPAHGTVRSSNNNQGPGHYFAYLAKRRRTYRIVRDVPSPPLDEEILQHLQRGHLPPPDYGYTMIRDRQPGRLPAAPRRGQRPPRVHKRTIIELHLAVLHECEAAEWDTVQEHYWQIVVEEFAQELMRDEETKNNILGVSTADHGSPRTNVLSTVDPPTDFDGTNPCPPNDQDTNPWKCMEPIQLATGPCPPNEEDPDTWSCMEPIQLATEPCPPNEHDPWSCMETIQLAMDPCRPKEEDPDPWSCMETIQLAMDPCAPYDCASCSCMETMQLAKDPSASNADDRWNCMETIQLEEEQRRAHSDPWNEHATPNLHTYWIPWIDRKKHLVQQCTTQPWLLQLTLAWKQYLRDHMVADAASGEHRTAATMDSKKHAWKQWIAQQHRQMSVYREQEWFHHLLVHIQEETAPEKRAVPIAQKALELDNVMGTEDVLRVRDVPRTQLHKQPYMKKRATANIWILLLALVIEQCEVECRLQETELYVDDLLAQL